MKKRIRRSARIVLRQADGRFLLFKFSYAEGVLAGRSYWALPGGGLEDCETPEEGAVRELREETGVSVSDTGPVRFESEYGMTLMCGEDVVQHDFYFVVPVAEAPALSRDGFTEEERETLVEARWWTVGEMAASSDGFMPENLGETILGAFASETS